MSGYSERQEDEIDFLQAVFPAGELEDLRLKDPWKIHRPPEFILFLNPQKSMGGSVKDQRPVSIKLHAKYPIDYPDSVPELSFIEPQGLTSDHVKELTEEVEKLAKENVGEVMMLELAQHIQVFLHKHDRPPVSLYEEMVERQRAEERREREREEKERQLSRIKEEEQHRQIEEEIMRKKAELQEQHSGDSEELDSEEDSGSNTSRELCYETPPTGTPPSSTHSPMQGVSASTGVHLQQGCGGVSMKREGGERVRAKANRGVRLQRGKYLGESSAGGNSVCVAMDIDTGELLVIYEWSLQCRTVKKGDTRRLKQVSSIQQEFESIQGRGVHHPNLVQYLAMNHTYLEKDNTISVELHMEYVSGGCISNLLRNPFCGPIHGETLCHYTKQLLEALSYLHSQGIVHNDLRPSLVFLDGGGVKLGGFSIVKRLADLHRTMNVHTKPPSVTGDDEGAWLGAWPSGRMVGKKGDILKLGMLLLCMAVGKLEISYPPSIPEHLPPTLRDFLAKCLDRNEQRRFPAHELLHHPFVSPSPHSSKPLSSAVTATTVQIKHKTTTGLPPAEVVPMHFQRSDSIVGSPAKPFLIGRSRLETEFEELEVLGSGGFGDVIKVRNHLDGRLYALKKIRIRSGSKMMTRITREVELLSQMNHENVVRYYNAWIETYGEQELKRLSGVDLSEEQSDSDDASHDDDQTNGISIEFRNETSPSEGSDSDSDSSLSDSELNPFHSTFNSKTDDLDSFVTFEASAISGRGEGEESQEGVFMSQFSDNSEEGGNILGNLESEVMNTSISRYKPSTATESSDTVVFMDSSTVMTSSKIIPDAKSKRRRERRKQKDSGQIQFLYIQMEYCERETLRQLIDSGELQKSDDRVWRLFREIVEGLEHIHSKGMIHRDLKPGNIFLNSSGHIKIGDFGLATSSYKHPVTKQSSIHVNPNASLMGEVPDGDTGLVGTAMYVSPELHKQDVRYSQKVDLYSVGIILFEMCHPPAATAMERHKLLVNIRKREIIFPSTFDKEKQNQEKVIRWLLNHNPHERPTSKQLLQSPLLPLKMEDEELQEVLLRTLQSTNSSQYSRLIDELFAQESSRVSEFSYFLDPQDNKRTLQKIKKSKFSFLYNLLHQLVHSRLESLFTRHGATPLSPPLLCPRSTANHYSGGGGGLSLAQFMDRSGAIVTLPHDHRVAFARYVCHNDITYLKRYCIAPVYRENKVLGSHPREHLECQFDIVSPSPASLVPDAEIVYLVSELISELPGLQEGQYRVLISHTSLLSSLLSYCSVPRHRHKELNTMLQKITSGAVKSSELEKWLKEKNLQLSPLATKTLQKFISAEIEFELESVRSLLDPLIRDKTAGSHSSLALQDLTTVVNHLRRFGAKEQVYLCPGLAPAQAHFGGVIFQYVTTPPASQTGVKRSRRSRRVPLARGGRYDPLLSEFRRPGKQPNHPSVSVVGVSIMWEGLMGGVLSACQQGNCQVTKCSVLVCWLGRESLQRECISLVKTLWSQGIAADILYESIEVDSVEDIQDFCRRNFIPHMVILNDKTLLFERKQVKVRTLESGKVIEKTTTIAELVEYLQQRQMKHQHSIERADSSETRENVRTSSSYGSEGQSTTIPPINVNTIVEGKLTGHLKRRYHDQALKKLIPFLQRFSSKQPFEVLVVDLKADHLSALAAECNKLLGVGESLDVSSVVKGLYEHHNDVNKKYIVRICDAMTPLFTGKKRVPLIFLYSLTAEYCQTIINSLESLNPG